MDFLHLNLPVLVRAIGYVGLFVVVFAESGLLVGFFLPGDSLLFTAGFLASQGYLHLIPLLLILFAAAVLGDSVGYFFGKKIGPKIFTKKDSWFFHQNNVEKAKRFYEAHGKKTIILARFLPVVRTFAPILAGVGMMKYSIFILFNVIGALLWTCGLTLLGYFLGNVIPDIDQYLLPIIVGIILLSILPTLIHVGKEKSVRDRIRSFFKKLF